MIYQDAVLWNIMIIGEAMSKLLEKEPNIAITEARRIANCRNYIVHAYDSIKPDIIWAIVVKELPFLSQELEAMDFAPLSPQ